MTLFAGPSLVESYLEQIHNSCLVGGEGALADYIPELAGVDPTGFGLSLALHDGYVYSIADADIGFTIQSVSKPLTYALALTHKGFDAVDERIGVEPSGEAFNEISVDSKRRPRNPMINAGAILSASLLLEVEPDVDTAFGELVDFYSACAGRKLVLDEDVYRSEMKSGARNRAIAYMLQSFGVLHAEPEHAIDLYFRQCSVVVTTDDLAVIGGTLANGGVNPRTGRRAVSQSVVQRVLSVMTTCGMYDGAGDWVTTVGLPAKSGVGGGIMAVLPGQLGIGVYSPLLDEHGNSVRGVKACKRLSSDLGLHMFNVARESRVTVRGFYSAHELHITTDRSDSERRYLHGKHDRIRIYELQGDLTFSGTESVLRRLRSSATEFEVAILDLSRVDHVDEVSRSMFVGASQNLRGLQRSAVIVDPDGVVIKRHSHASEPARGAQFVVTTMHEALTRAEDFLLKLAVEEG
ncbi:glutaminase A [Gordonia rubripertincta]|uniref:Glutaminase n=1 Tax=Gordonia rubripertincta TaxID=36822 RepID=A0ABT4MT62_GORRU|nr:glutaminase A [Gordonia rubripertincta]MCZ4550198.1 glutaminase A [Gordonia rubripertincta]